MSNFLRQIDKRFIRSARLTGSGLVCRRPCLLLSLYGSMVAEDVYVSPTGYNDPDPGWLDETNAYDESVGSYAKANAEAQDFCSWLELTLPAVVCCSGVRILAPFNTNYQAGCWADYWDGSAWVQFFYNEYLHLTWTTLSFSIPASISKIRIAFANAHSSTVEMRLNELDFIRRKVLDVGIYNGLSSGGQTKARLVLSQTGCRKLEFDQPIYCPQGVYAAFSEVVGECVIEYLPLER